MARVRRHQQQARRLRAVGAQHDGAGALEVLAPVAVEVGDAGDAVPAVHVDAEHVALAAHLAAPGGLRLRNHGPQRRGLCLHLAAETDAEAAVRAGRAAAIGHGGNRHRRGKRVQPELARAALEQHAGGFHGQGRHRIGPRSRRVERAGAREARHADFPLDLGVVGLEFRVVDRPVGEARPGDRAEQAAFLEVHLVEPPEVGGEVVAAAAHHPRVPQRREVAHALGFVPGRLAKGLRAGLRAVQQRVVVPVIQFVVPEVRGGEARALLEHQHLEAGLRQLARHHAAGGAGADHHEIDRVVRLERAGAHDCDSLPYGTKPG